MSAAPVTEITRIGVEFDVHGFIDGHKEYIGTRKSKPAAEQLAAEWRLEQAELASVVYARPAEEVVPAVEQAAEPTPEAPRLKIPHELIAKGKDFTAEATDGHVRVSITLRSTISRDDRRTFDEWHHKSSTKRMNYCGPKQELQARDLMDWLKLQLFPLMTRHDWSIAGKHSWFFGPAADADAEPKRASW